MTCRFTDRGVHAACAHLLALAVLLATGATASAGTVAAAGAERTVAPPPAPVVLDAAWALPGALGLDTTLSTLRRRYGEANVRIVELDGAEGETQRGIELFGDDPSRRLQLFMQDETTLTGVSLARAAGTHSRWHLDNGVRLGMGLAELVALNGRALTFNGMEWDYGGVVADWHGGKLANVPGSATFRAVSLAAVDDAPARSYPLGDGLFRSDDPAFPRQGRLLRVAQISVAFIAPD